MPRNCLPLSQPVHYVTFLATGVISERESFDSVSLFCLEFREHLSSTLLVDCHLFCNYIKCALGSILAWKVSVCE